MKSIDEMPIEVQEEYLAWCARIERERAENGFE